MKRCWLLLLLLPGVASATPRFAARHGARCGLCHVNPSGGGVRNAYGRGVFAPVWLPMSTAPGDEPWLAEEQEDRPDDAERGPLAAELGEWLAFGADARAAYLYVRPDEPLTPGGERPVTDSFFLMQADLYQAAELGTHVTLVVDVGVYAGFEAWGLFRAAPEGSAANLYAKVGRFMPAFGTREVDHQLFVREGVGFGAADRDTGLEISGLLGPWLLQASLLNGTLGDTPFDVPGTDRRRFEKALALRLSTQLTLGPLVVQAAASFYLNKDYNQANPLFLGALPDALLADVGAGLDELRAGASLGASLGPLSYLADVVWVRDDFYADVPRIQGYASYQELAWLIVQGLELGATVEHKDPALDIADNATLRAGVHLELYPWPHTELRLMGRRTWGPGAVGAWDALFFTHLFF